MSAQPPNIIGIPHIATSKLSCHCEGLSELPLAVPIIFGCCRLGSKRSAHAKRQRPRYRHSEAMRARRCQRQALSEMRLAMGATHPSRSHQLSRSADVEPAYPRAANSSSAPYIWWCWWCGNDLPEAFARTPHYCGLPCIEAAIADAARRRDNPELHRLNTVRYYWRKKLGLPLVSAAKGQAA